MLVDVESMVIVLVVVVIGYDNIVALFQRKGLDLSSQQELELFCPSTLQQEITFWQNVNTTSAPCPQLGESTRIVSINATIFVPNIINKAYLLHNRWHTQKSSPNCERYMHFYTCISSKETGRTHCCSRYRAWNRLASSSKLLNWDRVCTPTTPSSHLTRNNSEKPPTRKT